MINLIIWFASFLCPNPHHSAGNNVDSKCVQHSNSSNFEGDTGGETGGGPRLPPPPPPPGG